LEIETARPDFWGMPESAGKIAQELADLKNAVEFWHKAGEEMIDLRELINMESSDENLEKELEGKIETLEKELRKEELLVLLSGKYDKKHALMTISSGQGGHDAEDFVRMLFRMYSNYFEKKRWKYQILHEHFSEEPGGSDEAGGERGLRSIALEVETPFAYGYLKNESGVHRLVRVSPFDAKKLRHTSFALMEVVPEVEDVEMSEIELDERDLKIEFSRSSGAGGQNVNKRETAVRIVHLPTGVSVSCQNERSQAQNREKAMHLLKAKIFNYLQQQKTKEKEFLKKRIEPSWGNQIRNYVLHPYKLVKDLRTGVEKTQIESIWEGDIDDFIEAGLSIKS
jgi:peptide chain release factor 2